LPIEPTFYQPLRDTDDALKLNWFELTEIDAKGKEKYKNAWLTTHKITEQNVSELVLVQVALGGKLKMKTIMF
jgi:hypothetical protein